MADQETTVLRTTDGAGTFDGALERVDRTATVPQQGFASSGRLDAVTASNEQGNPDAIFEVADPPAQGLLVDSERFRRAAETAVISDRQRVTQMPQLEIHSYKPSKMARLSEQDATHSHLQPLGSRRRT